MATSTGGREELRSRLGAIRPRLPRSARPGVQPEAPGEPSPAVATVEDNGLRWIHIERPRLAEREWLTAHFDFHPLAFEDLVSRNQRPKVDVYDDYLFIILYFPSFEKATGRLKAVELDLLVGPDYLITIPNDRIVPLSRLFDRVAESDESRAELFAYGSGYLLYRIVDEAVDAGFPMLRQMGSKLEDIEDALFEGRARELVRDISSAKSEIINFRRIVRPQRVVYRDLEKAVSRYRAPDLDLYFDDVTDASERIWDVLENYKEQIESLESTNESVISHRVNDVLRVLTIFSVLVLPLTFVASLWGMNVELPFADQEQAFGILAGIMVAVLVVTLAVFHRRGLL
ncbi:MAG TPA: magnesium transporter CorA family protein [Patescibacteria group bacterium]|nr:magnesium transporter CorA family protein [Patescibacteria group bacterium]